jgi:hypothetical protein
VSAPRIICLCGLFSDASHSDHCSIRVLRHDHHHIFHLRNSVVAEAVRDSALSQHGETLRSFCVTSRSKRIVDTSRREKIVKYIIIGVTVVITIAAMRYIRGKQSAVKPAVIYERRKRRQAQLKPHGDSPSPNQSSGAPFFPPRPLAV